MVIRRFWKRKDAPIQGAGHTTGVRLRRRAGQSFWPMSFFSMETIVCVDDISAAICSRLY